MSNPLLTRLGIVYGQPDSGDPVSYLAEIAKMLVKYPPHVLERAGDLIIRTHRGRSFPKPSEIVTACEDCIPETTTDTEIVRDAEWKAACFVCKTEHNPKTGRQEPIGFEFSMRFRGHPWVEQAEREGWAKELRSHLRWIVKRRILEGKPYSKIEDLMPDRKWVEAARAQAERYAKAKEWRDQQPEPPEANRLEAAVRRLIGNAARKEAAA
jgi:hypothetical protein